MRFIIYVGVVFYTISLNLSDSQTHLAVIFFVIGLPYSIIYDYLHYTKGKE